MRDLINVLQVFLRSFSEGVRQTRNKFKILSLPKQVPEFLGDVTSSFTTPLDGQEKNSIFCFVLIKLFCSSWSGKNHGWALKEKPKPQVTLLVPVHLYCLQIEFLPARFIKFFLYSLCVYVCVLGRVREVCELPYRDH